MGDWKENSYKRQIRRKRLLKKIGLLILVLSGLWIWTLACERTAHQNPQYAMVNIEGILEKEVLDEQDYEVIRQQTGLSATATMYLYGQNRQEELFLLQEAYFKGVSVWCFHNTPITKEERIIDEEGNIQKGMPIPYVENGDILLTYCSHFLGWRNGHAGIVVDSEKRLVAEAQVLGKPAVITSLDKWEKYPSFAVLRIEGMEKEVREQVAWYAVDHLVGVSYHLTAGIRERLLGETQEGSPSGTQCAHLVWYAYRHFGVDLDSDGGLIVTPDDIMNSPEVTIIQRYGM